MSEKEPIIDLTPRKRKDKVIFEAKKEPVKTPITKEAHRRQLILQKDYCIDQIEIYREKIRSIEAMIERIDEHIESGMLIRCFDEGDHLSYEAVEKPPLGFPRPSANTKDASTWKQETERKHGKRE